jgi:ceramide glucosyltransferase
MLEDRADFIVAGSSKSICEVTQRAADICYSRAVLEAFYVVIILQIAVGVYSLWNGFEWVRMVRARLTSHAGFYTPQAALICPCKGNERGLEENLLALTRFDYPNYEIYFALATSLDPALKIIERVKAASSRPVHILIAGPPEDCGEKVFNLARTVEGLPEKFEVLVFVDSDARLPRGWLTKLVAPLQNIQVGATTGYRWIFPSGTGMGMFGSALASAWNAAVATLLGKPKGNFCWGGATAIRRKTFDDVNVLEAWKGAVSDDFALTNALQQANRPIVFCSECFAATIHPWTWTELLEFTNRQMLITRIYSNRRWLLGGLMNLAYVLSMLYAAYVILYCMVDGDPWSQLVLVSLAVPLLAAMKGGLRVVAINEAIPEWKIKLPETSVACVLLAPIVPFLFAWNFVASSISKRIRWRGIRYELISPNSTRILKR